jgi:hypothetical protein
MNKKRGRLLTFLGHAYGTSGDDYFSTPCLVRPGIDRGRSSYRLKEAALAAVFDALRSLTQSASPTDPVQASFIIQYCFYRQSLQCFAID